MYYVKTMLARFCDGLRQISYDLWLVLGGLRPFLTILAINEINNEIRVILLPCYKTVLNRKESSINTCKSLNFISTQIKRVSDIFFFNKKKSILQKQNSSKDLHLITAWKVKALEITCWKSEDWSGALDKCVGHGSKCPAQTPVQDHFPLLLFFFSFLRVIEVELFFLFVVKFAGKECQRTGIQFITLTLMSPPSTYTSYYHLVRGTKKN